MTTIFAESALLPDGWARDVRLTIDAAGDIAAVARGAAPGDSERCAILVPGLPDLHSHAFQRAMAGLAERAGPAGDDFWTWRELMYRFASRLGPAELEAIAGLLYVELLRHGYTAVCEFHYVHNDPGGAPYEIATTMVDALCAAAGASGIGLTLLPVLYQQAGFGGRPPSDAQKRFVLPTDAFLALIDQLAQRHRRDRQIRIGIAPHSLRAVTPETLRAVLAATPGDAPVHIHVAEQVREVEECLAWSGARPVEWLVANAAIAPRWCLVHATHMTDAETRAFGRSGAVAGLCPTTEANLGDGFFALGDFLDAGGRFGVGSDSNVCVDAAEELRWLEYGQRLRARTRNVAARGGGNSTGAALFRAALAGGAQAAGRPIGALAPGHRADLVALDRDHPALLGRAGDALLDSWIFAGGDNPVTDVMVGGQWVVRDGHHPHEEQARAAYARAVAKLGE